jgi:type IV secretory pathway component VirB8
MDPVQAKLEALEKKIDAIYTSVEKTRKYILWTAIITVAVIVLPLLGLVFVIPQFISYYGDLSNLGSLGM